MNTPQGMTDLFRDAWKLMSSRLPGATNIEEDHLATHFANTPLIFLNLSLYDAPVADPAHLDQILHQAKARATGNPHPWFHVIANDLTAPGWEPIAEAHGFAPAMKLTGMATQDLTPPTRPLAALDFRPIVNIETASDISTVNMLAYGLPPELGAHIANTSLWQPDSYGAVAYLEDQPVSATAAFPVDGTIYIALVATHPDHQRKGYAEATFRHVVTEAKRIMGDLPLTLHASEAGKPVYANMGFVASSEFTLLFPAGDGH
jgi:GNAT superfamily N-acetyltransferase